MTRPLLLVLCCLFPAATWAQELPFACELRDIVRLPNEHRLACDGTVTVLTDAQYQAQLQPGSNLLTLCPEGTTQASLAGHSVRWNTPSGDIEPCDAYLSPNDPTVIILATPEEEIALAVVDELMRQRGRWQQRSAIPGLTLVQGHLLVTEWQQVPRYKGERRNP